MKSILPWVIIVALLGGVYFLYTANKEKDAQLAKLSADSDELENLRAENEKLKKMPAESDELTRLRKESADLLRLRGETQRLRDENKQLTAQLAAARAQSSQAQQLAGENEVLRSQTQKLQEAQATAQQQTDACINNLRLIDTAKQQWALDNKKTVADVPTGEDLAPYLANVTTNQLICPAGGSYSINAVAACPGML
jgi:preprotein translocase subunit SecD